MIYIVIFFIFLFWVAERSINSGRLSPTSVMCSIWGITLLLASFYEDVFFPISSDTLMWVLTGIASFFVGGLISNPLSFIKIKSSDVYPIGILITSPLYLLVLFFSYKMALEGFIENENFYVGIRSIINYGEPSWFFIAFGYLYYLIYPVFFISCVSHYLNTESKRRKSLFYYHGLIALFYAVMATAKVKLLMLFITWIIIRSYYKKTSTKVLLTSGLIFMAMFFLSLFALNKVTGGDSIIESAISSIGNYSIANIYAFDSLNFNTIPDTLCINSGEGCVIMPFYDIGIFHTNVYTFLYDYIESGWFVFAVVMFLIGFAHNLIHKISKRDRNPFLVIISSLLFFPLVYQIINDQYTSSKYLVYLFVITFFLYFIKRRPMQS
ncbi:TPA: O-antigen polymerase [Enterobacter cloacae]|uniref:O-antigen polymerase n=1 Tax=Enterobacter cloacae TaxID=550 RepID=UPI0032AFC0F7